MRKLLLSSGLILLLGTASGQYRTYTSAIDAPDSSGLYRILVTPEIIAKSANYPVDIRLKDNTGTAVPYFALTETAAITEKSRLELPVIARRPEADSLTHVIIQNTAGMEISELLLTIGNTDANRTISISGSNDSLHWYIIRENIPVEGDATNRDRFSQRLLLPVTKYEYYNIAINGRDLLPVNILSAAIITRKYTQAAYQQLPKPRTQIRTDSKTTIVDIDFGESYQLDQLQLEIKGPRFFKRTVAVFGGDITSGRLLGNFFLSSELPAILPVQFKGSRLYLRINDQDNPPLDITSVRGAMISRYLAAYLEAGREYTLSFGDSALKAPRYDLDFFTDSIGSETKILSSGPIHDTMQPVNDTGNKKENRNLLWIVTGLVLVVLLFFTWKMTAEVKKRDV